MLERNPARGCCSGVIRDLQIDGTDLRWTTAIHREKSPQRDHSAIRGGIKVAAEVHTHVYANRAYRQRIAIAVVEREAQRPGRARIVIAAHIDLHTVPQ